MIQRLGVFAGKKDKPYFEAWLRRTGKQFAVSGRMTQTATVLAAEEGGSVEDWRTRLRILLEGGEVPSLELLTRIDTLLSQPSPPFSDKSTQKDFSDSHLI